MKFPMYKKELTDKAYQQNPYRAVNFHIDETGTLRCPNGRAFRFFYRQHIRGNHFGRQKEVYQCEDCTGCPLCTRLQADGREQDRPDEPRTDCHAPRSRGKPEQHPGCAATDEPFDSSRRDVWHPEDGPLVQENSAERQYCRPHRDFLGFDRAQPVYILQQKAKDETSCINECCTFYGERGRIPSFRPGGPRHAKKRLWTKWFYGFCVSQQHFTTFEA